MVEMGFPANWTARKEWDLSPDRRTGFAARTRIKSADRRSRFAAGGRHPFFVPFARVWAVYRSFAPKAHNKKSSNISNFLDSLPSLGEVRSILAGASSKTVKSPFSAVRSSKVGYACCIVLERCGLTAYIRDQRSELRSYKVGVVRYMVLVLALAGFAVACAAVVVPTQPAQAGCTMKCGGV
jgi:hypothetical protein